MARARPAAPSDQGYGKDPHPCTTPGLPGLVAWNTGAGARDCVSTALGAACLAGLEVGIWKNEEELGELLETERVFEPSTGPDDVEPRWQQWRRAVDRSRDWSDI